MIDVHRPNGQPFVVNALHIVTVESTPDTLVTLFGGDKLRVSETPQQVVARSQTFMALFGHQGHSAATLPAPPTTATNGQDT